MYSEAHLSQVPYDGLSCMWEHAGAGWETCTQQVDLISGRGDLHVRRC